jgi:asparagine synthase (glutamine-hydrolysing)
MSAQFGIYQFDEQPAPVDELSKAAVALEALGPDGGSLFISPPVSMCYRGLDSTKESSSACQPHTSESGAVVTWDGRLDNRDEIIRLLDDSALYTSTDVVIVGRAYDRFGTACFPRFIGDWAAAIWDPRRPCVLLARDFIGCRHLYYAVERRLATWSTILDPLLALRRLPLEIEPEYLAGWLSLFPATHLSPYRGIRSVPPSCFMVITPSSVSCERYWDFKQEKQIHYRDDRDYEEGFRTAFRTSVRRRLQSRAPILAELSGGIDSSSIVCMADAVVESEMPSTPRVETVSYYNDSEPNWDERPYFCLVEAWRGRSGHHIDVSQNPVAFQFDSTRMPVTPSDTAARTPSGERFAAILRSSSARVLLSGIGGDEFTGGVPTPIPALADLGASFQMRELWAQLKMWALQQRKPWFQLFGQVVRRFLPGPFLQPKELKPPMWLQPAFAKRYRSALCGYDHRLNLFGSKPSLQEGLLTVEVLRRQLGCFAIPRDPTYETRYPYLDRDLLEFLLAVPRQQLVRPGRRRCLLRRALAGLVPDEILNRRRKAYVARAVVKGIGQLAPGSLGRELILADLGIVDPSAFRRALDRAGQGEDVPVVPLARALLLETWLQTLSERRLPPLWRHSCPVLQQQIGREDFSAADTRFNPAG